MTDSQPTNGRDPGNRVRRRWGPRGETTRDPNLRVGVRCRNGFGDRHRHRFAGSATERHEHPTCTVRRPSLGSLWQRGIENRVTRPGQGNPSSARARLPGYASIDDQVAIDATDPKVMNRDNERPGAASRGDPRAGSTVHRIVNHHDVRPKIAD